MVQLESEGKGSTFSKASFVTDESSDINVDDPDFWQKWAEKAQLNLDELANKVCTVYTYMYAFQGETFEREYCGSNSTFAITLQSLKASRYVNIFT